jgi:hypothetical protein
MSESRFGAIMDLEEAFVDLAVNVAWPATPDLAGAVTTRLTAAGATTTRPHRWSPPSMFGRGRRLRWAVAVAALVTLLVAGAALGTRLGLDLLSIELGPAPTFRSPAPSPTPSGARASSGSEELGAGLGLGRRVGLDEAVETAAFPVLLPARLGNPAAVFAGGPTLRGQVALLYAAADDLPESPLLEGAGLLVTENRGTLSNELAQKVIASGGALERVDVGGERGYWIAGAPHFFWYLADDGTWIEDSRRRVGNTLAWQRGDLLLRIEGAIDLETALEIAASMR